MLRLFRRITAKRPGGTNDQPSEAAIVAAPHDATDTIRVGEDDLAADGLRYDPGPDRGPPSPRHLLATTSHAGLPLPPTAGPRSATTAATVKTVQLAGDSGLPRQPGVAAAESLPRFRSAVFDLPARLGTTAGAAERATGLPLWEVFTPTRPKRWGTHFVGRRQQMERVISALEQENASVVIFGERGLGKTSLANVIVERAQQAGYRVIRCACSSDITFEDMFRGLLRHVPRQLMSRQSRDAHPNAENFATLLPDGQFGATELTAVLSHLMHAERIVFVIDEFDRVRNAQLKNHLAEAIKNLSDIAVGINFLIIGVAESVEDLIGKHQSIQRNLFSMRLPLMDLNELHTLISAGEEAVGIEFDERVRQCIISLSRGLPYFAHLLCLHAGSSAVERGSPVVERADLGGALEKILEETDQIVVSAYERATLGERRELTTQVIFAAAYCVYDQYGAVAIADVRKTLAEASGYQPQDATLARTLSALAAETSGAILRRRSMPDGTTRFVFSNQMMRQYVLARQARRRGII